MLILFRKPKEQRKLEDNIHDTISRLIENQICLERKVNQMESKIKKREDQLLFSSLNNF